MDEQQIEREVLAQDLYTAALRLSRINDLSDGVLERIEDAKKLLNGEIRA